MIPAAPAESAIRERSTTDGHGRFRRFRNSAIALTFADRLTGIADSTSIIETSAGKFYYTLAQLPILVGSVGQPNSYKESRDPAECGLLEGVRRRPV